MSEPNYIPKEKIPRRKHTIYTRHEKILQLKGDIIWFYREYRRKRHWFKKDEWVFVKQLTEEEFHRAKFQMDQILLPGAFDYHCMVIEGEGYCDVGWD